jgi:hypothetical protein
MSAACIGEPISWLRLESMALGARDATATAHLEACVACRSCMDEIRADVVALPPLRVPEQAPSRWAWLRWAGPVAGLAAAAAIALLVLKPRAATDERVATVKGAGEVVIDVVRDRDGSIGMGATTFKSGDRWKVVVTCAPGGGAWVDVAVVESGSHGHPDFPLAPAHIACGNRVVVPGAFEITGTRPNRVCAVLAGDAAPARTDVLSDEGVACVTLRPE